MAGFLESALGAVCGLIEAGPVKIDNKLVEGLLGVGAVGIAGYAAYKVLNDKGAAENVATMTQPFRSGTELALEAGSKGLKIGSLAESSLLTQSIENPPAPLTPEQERARQAAIERLLGKKI